MPNQVVWFDIPALDIDRAIRFHSVVLIVKIEKQELGGMTIGVLPHREGEVSGCIFKREGEKPSDRGPLLYLNVQGRLDQAISQVEPNGGKVVQPKHHIGPYGYRAIVLDSEGNRLTLHST